MFNIFKKNEPTRAELIRELAETLASTCRKSNVDLTHRSLAPSQSLPSASAEWYAIRASALVYAIWTSLTTQEKVSPVIIEFQRAFLCTLDTQIRTEFLKIASVREAHYVEELGAALATSDTTKAMRLAGEMDLRIDGTFSEKLDSTGVPQAANPIESAALWRMVIDLAVLTKRLLDNLQRTAPQMFAP